MLINPESIRAWSHGKMAVLQTGAIEERSEHFFGFEKFTRNLARRSRMTAIISVNFAHRFGDFRELAKTEESTLLAVDLAETGLLRDYRTSGGKIAGAAIAEPSGVQSNAGWFSDRSACYH